MSISTPPRKRRAVWTPALGRVLMLSRPLPLSFPLLMPFVVSLLTSLVLSSLLLLNLLTRVQRRRRTRIDAASLRSAAHFTVRFVVHFCFHLHPQKAQFFISLYISPKRLKGKIRRIRGKRIGAFLLRSASLRSAKTPSLPQNKNLTKVEMYPLTVFDNAYL